ncbi:MAG: hypothetical protein ACRYFS_13210 [Janthinobacterium lividum]
MKTIISVLWAVQRHELPPPAGQQYAQRQHDQHRLDLAEPQNRCPHSFDHIRLVL